MRLFSERYDFESEIMDEDLDFSIIPHEEEIYEYLKYVTVSCKMENEIPIICLVYIERLLTKTGFLITNENWKRLCLICLCLGSKIWDDDSLENVHFPKVMGDVSLRMINRLEQAFLEFINYDLVVRGSEYAKYYFICRTIADSLLKQGAEIHQFKGQGQEEEWGAFPLTGPISAQKMQFLQRNSAKAEVLLRNTHERDIS